MSRSGADQEDFTTSRFALRQFDAHQDRLPAQAYECFEFTRAHADEVIE